MAQKTHCDVCDQPVTRDRGHLWANSLPTGHPLRNVSAMLTFYGSNRLGNHNRETPIDVCHECVARWLKAVVGATIEPQPVESQPVGK